MHEARLKGDSAKSVLSTRWNFNAGKGQFLFPFLPVCFKAAPPPPLKHKGVTGGTHAASIE